MRIPILLAFGVEDLTTARRQHLARRHMVSYRCRRCWRSFDTRREAAAHPEDGNCSIKERPATERFMRADDESVVEAYAGNAVDVWWALFRVLVPEVYGVDDDVLKTLYFPYYGAQAMAPIFLPPVTLPDHILQSVPATPWHGDTGVTDHLNPNLAQASLAAPTSFPARSSLSTAPVSAYTFNSQAFSLPIYQMTVSSAPPTQTPADNSVASLDFDIFDTDMDPSGLIHMSLEPPPPHVTPPEEPSPPHLQSQVQQRLYDRLAQRLEQAEAENETLREANRVNRAELIRMEKLLESVLATETTLGENAYERLSQVANMTVAVKKRMVC
ncbi:hypothetical protein B0T14DRAFT_528845 [Immersiella caudata]|uniref:Uncharacterized protein n=1 Tax=Immersiella caudata TaxID=314043 RepID=A0AA40BV11_9PEZI|nr:hypothetical protein B0T14DRAFT_528845 [Immersiella caudata]